MDIDDLADAFNESSSETDSIDSTLYDLATYPLNSINPPPPDLPDLLDALLVSDAALKKRLDRCAKLASDLHTRIPLLKNRLRLLREKCPQWRSDTKPRAADPSAAKNRLQRAFEAQEAVYIEMALQTTFLYTVLSQGLRGVLAKHIQTHGDIFGVFLGERHEHIGIEVADSTAMTCVSECSWYFVHGAYEWSKMPYTRAWTLEMGRTDWDWVRVREHISGTIEDARVKALDVVDRFHEHLDRFVPYWFWEDKEKEPEMQMGWSMQIKVSFVGTERETVTPMARYRKSEEAMMAERKARYQRAVKESADRQAEREKRVEEGKEVEREHEAEVNEASIVIDPIGYQVLGTEVFDGDAMKLDWSEGGHLVPLGSWLQHWGYREWLRKFVPGHASLKKAETSKSVPIEDFE